MGSVAAIAFGGAIGAVARYALASAIHGRVGATFPFGTLAVNVLGCFLLGLIVEMTETKFIIHPQLKLFLTIGVLGGFTTFSTFSHETLYLAREGMMWLALLNAAGSVMLGLLAVFGGIVVARLF